MNISNAIKTNMNDVLDADLYSGLIKDYGVSDSEYSSVSSYMTSRKSSLSNV